jgi:hypothetical protein
MPCPWSIAANRASVTVRFRAKASVILEPYSQEHICTMDARVYFGLLCRDISGMALPANATTAAGH